MHDDALRALMGQGETRTVRAPSPAAAFGSGSTVAAPKLDIAHPLKFRKACCVYEWGGQVLSATDADMAGTEVRVQLAGSVDLITDGDAGAFASFFYLFGNAKARVARRFLRPIPVAAGDVWTVTYRAVGGADVFPSMYFDTIEKG